MFNYTDSININHTKSMQWRFNLIKLKSKEQIHFS